MKYNNLITSDKSIRKRYLETCIDKDVLLEQTLPKIYSLKNKLIECKNIKEIFSNPELTDYLLIAAGASTKSLEYFTTADKEELLTNLFNKYRFTNFEDAVECILYRYVIQKGESFGGAIRNIIGFHGKEKITSTLINVLSEFNISFHWFNPKLSDRWILSSDPKYKKSVICKRAVGIAWRKGLNYRILMFNQNITSIKKNVDIVLINGSIKDFYKPENPYRFLMMGEIKSGIDLKNADEHWKTGWASLERIIDYFNSINHKLKISMVIGAVTEEVAEDIESKINAKKINYAVNITDDIELDKYCRWIISL